MVIAKRVMTWSCATDYDGPDFDGAESGAPLTLVSLWEPFVGKLTLGKPHAPGVRFVWDIPLGRKLQLHGVRVLEPLPVSDDQTSAGSLSVRSNTRVVSVAFALKPVPSETLIQPWPTVLRHLIRQLGGLSTINHPLQSLLAVGTQASRISILSCHSGCAAIQLAQDECYNGHRWL